MGKKLNDEAGLKKAMSLKNGQKPAENKTAASTVKPEEKKSVNVSSTINLENKVQKEKQSIELKKGKIGKAMSENNSKKVSKVDQNTKVRVKEATSSVATIDLLIQSQNMSSEVQKQFMQTRKSKWS